MHFILTTFGSSGDVFPMVGLGEQLLARGHRVTVATNDHFSGIAKDQGLDFIPLGTAEQYRECTSNPDLWHPQRSFNHIYQYFRQVLKRQHELIVDAAKSEKTVVIASCLSFGARMARDSHQIPLLTLHLQPAVIWSDDEPPMIAGLFGPRWWKSFMYRLGERLFVDAVVCPSLNEWRRELGLSQVRRVTKWWHSPDGIVCLFPDWYGPAQPDWPKPLIQTDFPLWNHKATEPLAPEVEHFLSSGSAPVVFTPGSANVHGRDFFDVAMKSCQKLGRRGIFLTHYPEQVPENLPEEIAHFSYVPLDLLLSRSAAFVHHGGIGSTSQAFLGGIPQVAMPLAHDQFDNGERIERLKLGASVPATKFTEPRLTEALKRLFNSPETAAACSKAQLAVAPRNGLALTADAILARFSV
ncbi:nucleotide disphospho-sugar-binding domain-containing protein [Planctomicrobium sp. SH527]|uniref:nucleotide disphospho-sugar-binding domain-containing protein n=1 Tax=Planctomicrobium sp. SH527 TaxID=3448123 RepID=UPI003F5CA1B4